MMFMMPMPPTSSDTQAMAARSSAITREACSAVCIICVRLRTVKSSSWLEPRRCLWRRSSRICVSARSSASVLTALTMIERTVPGKYLPNRFLCAALIGT